MLKIKDDVDLKELEKFGFSFIERLNGYVYEKIEKERIFITIDRSHFIFITSDDRCIGYSIGVIFDLIQAGLVEKV